MRRPNAFSGAYLERAAHLRKDDAFVARALGDPATAIVPVWRSRNLMRRAADGWQAAYVEVSHSLRTLVTDDEFVLLGMFADRTYFAIDVPGDEAPSVVPDATFEDLRMTGAQMPPQDAGCSPTRAACCTGATGTATAACVARPTARAARAT